MGSNVMKLWSGIVFLLGLLMIAFGCTKVQVEYVPRQVARPQDQPVSTVSMVEQRLMDQYRRWRGTPYRSGGMSRRGVDCSGFVVITYRDLFGRQLPRTTEEQEEVAREIADRRRQPGDLVFFKTGLFARHVGIWLGDWRFLHASSTDGVTLSQIDSGYWQEHYWKTARVQ